MNLHWEGEQRDRAAASAAERTRSDLEKQQVGEAITVANEFSEVHVFRVETRNGTRLMIQAPKSGQWITLDPLELESLTWQTPATFSAMIGHPFAPLFENDDGDDQRTRTEGES